MIENIKPLEEGEEFVSIDEAIEKIDKYKPPKINSKQEENPSPRNPTSPTLLLLDEQSEENSAEKTHDEWIEYWKNIQDGRTYASMPDFYIAFTQLKILSEQGNEEERKYAEALVLSLREDFDHKSRSTWLTSSTRIRYKKNKAEAEIIHHYGNKDSDSFPMLKKIVKVPTISNTLEGIERRGGDREGAYLQALFDTNDNPETIKETLEFISGKDKRHITIRTLVNRNEKELAVGFYGDNDALWVDAAMPLDGNIGRSRGVRYQKTK